jgi:dephospho-CoA kinase
MQRQNPNKKSVVLGITGGFGSGKSTVARIFASFGAKIMDADKIAHRVINPGSKVYKKIVATFGRGILKQDREIDRQKLARVVFNNKNSLKRLNNIVHPEVIRIIKNEIKVSRAKVAVLDAPLLLEAGLEKIVDKLIVVKITKDGQFKRIQNKTFLSKTDILKRIASQIPLRVKARLADFVIDNSGTIEKTKKQVERIRRSLWKN